MAPATILQRTAVLVAVALGAMAAGCSKKSGQPGKGADGPNIDLSRTITPDQVKKIRIGMSVPAVEAILDEGRTPDRSQDWAVMPDFMRRWGNSDVSIELHFLKGSVVGWNCKGCSPDPQNSAEYRKNRGKGN